jgi:hypothetical protein
VSEFLDLPLHSLVCPVVPVWVKAVLARLVPLLMSAALCSDVSYLGIACRGLMCMWRVLQELGTASAAPLPCSLASATSTLGKKIRWWVFLSDLCPNTHCVYNNNNNNSVALVHEWTIAIERLALASEVSAHSHGLRGVAWSVRRIPYGHNLGF